MAISSNAHPWNNSGTTASNNYYDQYMNVYDNGMSRQRYEEEQYRRCMEEERMHYLRSQQVNPTPTPPKQPEYTTNKKLLLLEN